MDGKRLLPPTVLFAAVMLMVAAHFLFPVARLIAVPWNLLGVVPILAGLFLNVWAWSLFQRAATTIQPFDRPSGLVQEGPYRISRHPMYLGMGLLLAGVAGVLGSASPWAVLPAFVAFVEWRFIRAEERAMEETLGQVYLAYRERVRRWI